MISPADRGALTGHPNGITRALATATRLPAAEGDEFGLLGGHGTDADRRRGRLADQLPRADRQGYVGFLGGFGGTIDMFLDAVVPVGSVSLSPLTSRRLTIDVAGLPTGGAVQVVRGTVDNAGTGTPTPNATVVETLQASDLESSNVRTVDTSEDCFHRLQVINSAGAVVGFGQPIWVLESEPTHGIPEKRRATV